MTTTITLKTHGWPVKVTTTDYFESKTDTGKLESWNVAEETIPPETTKDFYVTSSCHLRFDELPLPVEGEAVQADG